MKNMYKKCIYKKKIIIIIIKKKCSLSEMWIGDIFTSY